MDFKKGDIIEFCGEFFEVETNDGNTGIVWELNGKYERTGLRISKFYWKYGEECKLVKSA